MASRNWMSISSHKATHQARSGLPINWFPAVYDPSGHHLGYGEALLTTKMMFETIKRGHIEKPIPRTNFDGL